MKIFCDDSICAEAKDRLLAALPLLRRQICTDLRVDTSLAQLALITVHGLPDQAQLAVELQILPKPDRTRDHLIAACSALRNALRTIVDVKIAVRVTNVDPKNYLVTR